MKKKLLSLLVLATLPLVGCSGTETINNDEAVKKTIPALAKTTVDTYGESECLTVSADITSLEVEGSYGDYSLTSTLSGKLTFGLRNMYTTDVTQLQAGLVFSDCDLNLTIPGLTTEDYTFTAIENFSFGVYLSSGNIYIDISQTAMINGVATLIADVLNTDVAKGYIIDHVPEDSPYASTIKNIIESANINSTLVKTLLLGNGKYAIEGVLTNDNLPLLTKEELTEDTIADVIKKVFGLVTTDDLNSIMTLVHVKEDNTYKLSFDVKDPAIINRTYDNNMEKEAPATCSAVDLKVEAWTNEKGVFTGGSLNGSMTVSAKQDEEDSPINVKLSGDMAVGLDFSAYTIKNPSFSTFKTGNALVSIIRSIIESMMPAEETAETVE